MKNDGTKDPDRPKRIAKKAQEMADYCCDRQRYYSRKAQEFGYSQEIFINIGSTMQSAPDDPIFAGLEISLNKFHDVIREKEQEAEAYPFDVSSSAYALGTATTATASMVAFDMGPWRESLKSPDPPSGWSPKRSDQYVLRLEKLDPELGKLMRSVSQLYYGGAENAERAALLSMRQLYDHFFEIVAPDDDVRLSTYFAQKQGEKANQIHRKERIRYAVNERVPDKVLGQALEAQAEYILELYDKLNQLHRRGPLKRDEAKEVLKSMQTIMEQWIDALAL